MARHPIASVTWREFLCALSQDAEHMLALVAERQRYARIASHPIRRDGWLRVTEALVEVVEVIEAEMSQAAALVEDAQRPLNDRRPPVLLGGLRAEP